MSIQRIESLEVLRGVAACWVVVHHAILSVDHFIGTTSASLVLSSGYLGVDFFFILSGFIIAFSSDRLRRSGRGVRDYFRARLLRIYVPYLPLGIGMYFLYLLLPGLSEGSRDPGLVTSLTLLPSDQPPALSVAWTLVHELIFYVFFASWFVSRRVFVTLLMAWVGAILIVAYRGIEANNFWSYFVSPLNLYFSCGVAIFWLTSRVAVTRAQALICIGAGLLIVLMQVSEATPDRVWVGAGLVLTVFGAAYMPGVDRRWRWALLLGTASYSIYLVHNPFQSLLVRLLGAGIPGLTPNWGLALLILVSLLASLGYWYAYERPALEYVRSKLNAFGRAS